VSASGAGLFIEVRVGTDAAADAELAKQLVEVCPVDIFELGAAGELEISLENVDECTLCELCLAVGKPGAVRVLKLYDEGAELQRG
jgi:ferredoxin-like protein FixX